MICTLFTLDACLQRRLTNQTAGRRVVSSRWQATWLGSSTPTYFGQRCPKPDGYTAVFSTGSNPFYLGFIALSIVVSPRTAPGFILRAHV